MKGTMDDVKKNISELREDFKEYIAKIDRVIFEGNGHPSLMVRMASTERELESLQKERSKVLGGVSSLIINIATAALVAIGSLLFILWADHRPNTNTKGKTDAKVSAVHDGSDNAGR